MKKKFSIFLVIIVVIIGIIFSYKAIAGNNIKNKTYDYLETKGYVEDDISNIKIEHSFFNKLLSYNEWRILVEFKSDPDIIFTFTYRNNEIIIQDVNSTSMLNKEEILNYETRFNNGELKK